MRQKLVVVSHRVRVTPVMRLTPMMPTLAVASDHKTLAASNKNELPAWAKPVLASPRESGLPLLTPAVWHLL